MNASDKRKFLPYFYEGFESSTTEEFLAALDLNKLFGNPKVNPIFKELGTIIGLYNTRDFSIFPSLFIIKERDYGRCMIYKSLNRYIKSQVSKYDITEDEIIKLYNFPFMKNKLI